MSHLALEALLFLNGLTLIFPSLHCNGIFPMTILVNLKQDPHFNGHQEDGDLHCILNYVSFTSTFSTVNIKLYTVHTQNNCLQYKFANYSEKCSP